MDSEYDRAQKLATALDIGPVMLSKRCANPLMKWTAWCGDSEYPQYSEAAETPEEALTLLGASIEAALRSCMSRIETALIR